MDAHTKRLTLEFSKYFMGLSESDKKAWTVHLNFIKMVSNKMQSDNIDFLLLAEKMKIKVSALYNILSKGINIAVYDMINISNALDIPLKVKSLDVIEEEDLNNQGFVSMKITIGGDQENE